MEIADSSPLGWLLLFGFAVFCGMAVFYIVYGAARLFEGDSGSDDGSAWLLNHRTPIVIVLSITSLIVMAVLASGA